MLHLKIKELREKLRISQQELGEKAGFNQQEISNIERGIRKRFTTDELQSLAAALGVSVGRLLESKAG